MRANVEVVTTVARIRSGCVMCQILQRTVFICWK